MPLDFQRVLRIKGSIVSQNIWKESESWCTVKIILITLGQMFQNWTRQQNVIGLFDFKFFIRHLAFGFGICLNYIISIAPNIFPCQDKYFSIFAPSPTFLSPLAFSWTQRRPSLSVASPSAALTPLNGPLSVLSPLSSLSSSLPTLLLLLLLLFVSLLFSGSVTYSAKTQNCPFLESFPVSGVE